jgi:exonuclease V gamma subunit
LHALPEREPFVLNALESWQIATEWLENLARGRPEASRLGVERARGRLPLFVPGERVYEKLRGDVSAIAEVFGSYTQGATARSVEVDLSVAGVRLSGAIGDVWPQAHVRTQYSQLGRRHELRQFVRQVVLRCLAERDPTLRLPETSVLIGRKRPGVVGVVRFELQAPAATILEDLIGLYCESLTAPVPLFAFASRCYVQQLRSKGEPAGALRMARNEFGDRPGVGQRQRQTEVDMSDEYVQQLFGDFEQMHGLADGAFEAAALRLYGPLLDARRDD